MDNEKEWDEEVEAIEPPDISAHELSVYELAEAELKAQADQERNVDHLHDNTI